jgi:hypothetical protein
MATKKEEINEVSRFEKGTIDVVIIGTSPLIYNRMSEKARRELLLPKGRKTTIEKATTLKHDPMTEYRESVYRFLTAGQPTLLYHMASAFKGAMATAALDIPGAKKAQIGRLVWIEGDHIPILGTPQLFMSIVRSADMNRTPDVRTRAILPTWGCLLSVSFVKGLINANSIVNLLSAGGMTVGVGDYRPEKGKGNYGQFELTGTDDPRWVALQSQGYAAQAAALENPATYDQETQTLLSWYGDEVDVRQKSGRIATPAKAIKAVNDTEVAIQ